MTTKQEIATFLLRIAIGTGFLSAVASRLNCRLPQKQYVLKVDKLINFKNVKHEKESIHPHPDCHHTQGV